MELVTSHYYTPFGANMTPIESSPDKSHLEITFHSPRENLSDLELLESRLGPRYRTTAETIGLSMVYSIIFLTGVVGNICTCIVISKNRYMHTATNYYLFSLAISDVLTLILGLPPELYAIWEAYPWMFGQPYCLFKVFLTEMTSSASILTITAFTVERYVAICHPIRAQQMSSLARAVKIICFIWFCAALTALPYPIHTRTFIAVVNPKTGAPLTQSLMCNIPMKWTTVMRAVFQFSTFLLFVFPMTVITVLYILIGLALRRAIMFRNESKEGQNNGRSSGKIPSMLVAVVVAFFICWAPFHAQRLMTIYISEEQWSETLMEIQNILWYLSGVLYFVSSTVNPMLYNLMSRKYRQAFIETLCSCCVKSGFKGQAKRFTTYTFYSSSARKRQSQTQQMLGNALLSQAYVESGTPLFKHQSSRDDSTSANGTKQQCIELKDYKQKYRYTSELESVPLRQPRMSSLDE